MPERTVVRTRDAVLGRHRHRHRRRQALLHRAVRLDDDGRRSGRGDRRLRLLHEGRQDGRRLRPADEPRSAGVGDATSAWPTPTRLAARSTDAGGTVVMPADGRDDGGAHGGVPGRGRAASSRCGSRASTSAPQIVERAGRVQRGTSSTAATSRGRRRSTDRCSAGRRARTRSDGPESARYTEWQLDGQTIGGMLPMPPMVPGEVPTFWLVYFAVDDVEASLAQGAGARRLNGDAADGSCRRSVLAHHRPPRCDVVDHPVGSSNRRWSMTTAVRPDIDFNDLDRFPRECRDWFRWLREHEPLSWHPGPEGQEVAAVTTPATGRWCATRTRRGRTATGRVLERRSRRPGLGVGGDTIRDMSRAEGVGTMMILTDPTRHTAYRKLVNRGFTPRSIAVLEPAAAHDHACRDRRRRQPRDRATSCRTSRRCFHCKRYASCSEFPTTSGCSSSIGRTRSPHPMAAICTRARSQRRGGAVSGCTTTRRSSAPASARTRRPTSPAGSCSGRSRSPTGRNTACRSSSSRCSCSC